MVTAAAYRGWRGRKPHVQESAMRMRMIRSRLGLTQRQWAYLLDVAQNTISAWENGHALPSALAERAIRDVAAMHGLDLHTMEAFE